MSMQKPLGDLQKILQTLDERFWKVSPDFNDADAVLHFIEKHIIFVFDMAASHIII